MGPDIVRPGLIPTRPSAIPKPTNSKEWRAVLCGSNVLDDLLPCCTSSCNRSDFVLKKDNDVINQVIFRRLVHLALPVESHTQNKCSVSSATHTASSSDPNTSLRQAAQEALQGTALYATNPLCTPRKGQHMRKVASVVESHRTRRLKMKQPCDSARVLPDVHYTPHRRWIVPDTSRDRKNPTRTFPSLYSSASMHSNDFFFMTN